MNCAQERIRTATSLRMPPPQDGASTNFATWAYKKSLELNDKLQPIIQTQDTQ